VLWWHAIDSKYRHRQFRRSFARLDQVAENRLTPWGANPILVGCPPATGEGPTMRNSDQKAKDMAESILPSTRRTSARVDRRAIHARHRARQLHQLRRLELGMVDTEFDVGIERARTGEVRDLVWDRRAADKIGPLQRWARVRLQRNPALRHLPLEDQVRAFAQLMPDNLIGRHAVDHIRWALESDLRRAQRPNSRPAPVTSPHVAETAAAVHRILEAGRHRELNDGIRRLVRREEADLARARGSGRYGPPPTIAHRLLAGLHDVEAFAQTHATSGPVGQFISGLAASCRDEPGSSGQSRRTFSRN